MLKQVKFMGLLLILALIITACGGASNSGGTSGDAQEADQPPTRTPFPTFEFVAPTNPPVFNSQSAEETEEADVEEATAEAPAVELDEKAVSRGLGRYEALECAICHGEGGAGTDEFEGLLDYSGSLNEFTTFMRTGGTIGNSHQYSTDRLSENGTKNLYQYILSLTMSE